MLLIRLLISAYYLLIMYTSIEYIHTYIESNQLWISIFYIVFGLFSLVAIPGYFIKKKIFGWISIAFISFLTLFQIGAFFWGLFTVPDLYGRFALFTALSFILCINLPIFFYTRKQLLLATDFSTIKPATD